jgi:hypothetical protein
MIDEKDENEETPDTSEATEGNKSAEKADDKVSDDDPDNAAGGKVFQ